MSPFSSDAFKQEVFPQLLQVWSTGEQQVTNYFHTELNSYFEAIRSKVKDGIISITRDRTKEYLLEQGHQRNHDLANSILNSSLDSIFAMEAIRDEKGDIIDFLFIKVNTVLLNKLKLREEDFVGKTYLTVSPHANKYGLFDMKLEAMKKQQPLIKEVCFEGLGIDGWYRISVVPLGTNGLVETFTDITESKSYKDKIERAAQRFETVVNTSKAGMFTLLPVKNEQGEVVDFRFSIVNDAIATFIGEKAEALRGALASGHIPGYKTNKLFASFKDAYVNHTPFNFDFQCQNGTDLFFNIDIVKIGDEVLVTFTDFTTLKRLQRALEMKVEELKRSNAYLEDFAYAASHDMKEPLRKILMFSDRLKHSLTSRMDDNEIRLFERMEASTERMHLLVDDLLEFSHVSDRPHQMETIDLNEKLQKVLTDLELSIMEKKAKVIIAPLPTIQGFRRQLQQLFQNLISNALKYSKTDTPPEITITSHVIKGNEAPMKLPEEHLERHFHLIEVSDNGIGFEQEYAERIFELFQRLHGKAEYGGTGVGLSIARKVVDNHHGYIWATAQPAIGATFHVLLPVVD